MANHIVDEGRTDAAATTDTNAALTAAQAPGEIFNGYLDDSSDSDWIRVELGAGASYMITIEARDPDGTGPQRAAADTVLEIFDADGNSVEMKDDNLSPTTGAVVSNHPSLMFEPETAGVYYLSVSSYASVAATDNSGGYSLRLTELAPPADPNRDMELTGTTGADKLLGAGGEDTIRGGTGDDFLSGGDANDELFGEAGDDTLEGGPGEDTLDGGANGFGAGQGDTVTYARSAESVRVNLGRAEAMGGDAEGDVIQEVENIIGSAGDDWLRGDTNNNILTGLAGDDTLIGGGGGNDTLNGGAGDDTLNGGEGDDTLIGGAGADTITGGPGGDTLSYAGSDEAVDIRLRTGHASGGHADGDEFATVEHVTGSDHDDRLAGDNRPAGESTGGDNTLMGGGGDDEIYGGSGDDTLNGGAGDDTLFGGAGGDTLSGGAGDDNLIGGLGGDTFTGGAGTDTVSYANARDEKVTVNLAGTIRDPDTNNASHSDGDSFSAGDVENVIGSPRGDTIHGSGGANEIWGGAGADVLVGHGGDDTLDGGPGGDILDGDFDSSNASGTQSGDVRSLTGTAGTDTVTYENSDAGVRVTVNATTGNEGGDAEGDRLFNVENLVGSNHNDRLFGDGANNKLTGGDGDDRIVAGVGDDTVEGGAGADTMDGDAVTATESGYAAAQVNADTLSYASSTGGVRIDLSSQYAVAASAQQQRTHYATGDGGDAAGDRFRGFENVTGGMGNDRLTGDGWNNILIGGPGADALDGGTSRLTIPRSDGVITQRVITAGPDGTLGNADDVTTEVSWLNAAGLAARQGVFATQTITTAGPDGDLAAAADNVTQTVTTTTPADQDTVSYAGSTAGVTIAFSERRVNNEDVTIGTGSGGDAAGDRLLNIEKVIGTAHNDTFIASKTIAGGQQFDGGVNATMDDPMTTRNETVDSDTVSYANFNTAVQVYAANHGVQFLNIENITGGSGGDLLEGNARPNRLEGGGGIDTLRGFDGADTLIGGPGGTSVEREVLVGGDGFDLLNGGAGADAIDGDAGAPTHADLATRDAYQAGNIQSFWSVGNGRANVDNDANAIATSYGGDTVTYAGSNRGVTLELGVLDVAGGDDTFGGSNFADDFTSASATGEGGYAEDDTVVNVENIIGSDHDDTLGGNNWFNVLTGGKGDDRLTGDENTDAMNGPNSDIFVFAPGDSTGSAGDVITDFTLSGGTRDAIDLRAFNFDIDRDSDGDITTTMMQLDAQGLKISDLVDADEDGTKDDRVITLPDDGKITLLDLGTGSVALTTDNFVFDLM